jgi:hypothetical protein
MAEAMGWLRINSIFPENLDDNALELLAFVAGIGIPTQKTSPFEDAFKWLRNNKVNPQEIDDPTVDALAKLAGASFIERHFGLSDKKSDRKFCDRRRDHEVASQ